jgi:zinc protease
VQRYYGGWAPGYRPPAILAEARQESERRIGVTYPGRSLPIVWLSYKIDRFDPANRTRVAADLLAELAFGQTSELYRRLVLEEQVVEFLDADPNWSRDPGLFDVYARVKDPSRIDYVVDAIDETIAVYRSSPPDAARLADVKSMLRYGFTMALDTPEAVAGALARPIAISGGLEGIEALYRTYATITPEEIELAAREYLAPERRTRGVLRSAQ